MVYPYNGILFYNKKEQLLINATTKVNVKNLSDRSQTQKSIDGVVAVMSFFFILRYLQTKSFF